MAVVAAFGLAGLGVSPRPAEGQDADPLTGTWTGALSVPGATLRLVFEVESGDDGSYSTTLISVDQGNVEITVEETVLEGRDVTFSIPSISGSYSGQVNVGNDSIDGTWTQGGNAFPLVLTRTDDPPTLNRPQEPTEPLPYHVEDVRFANVEEGHQLAGTFTAPEGPGPFPAVVLISGSGPQDRNEALLGHKPFLVLSDHLTRAGIAVLRFDDRGVGESEGTFATATSEHFAADVRGAVRYLKARQDVNAEQVGLVGHSEGGLIAPIVAVDPDQVAFIVLLAGPGLDGEAILLTQSEAIQRAQGVEERTIRLGQQLSRDTYAILRNTPDSARAVELIEPLIRESFEAMGAGDRAEAGLEDPAAIDQAVETTVAQMTGPWFRRFLEYDPVPVLEQVRVPVLSIVGALDLQVLAEPNTEAIRSALERAGNDDVEVHILPGLNHLFQHAETGAPGEYAEIEETFAPEALQLVSDWILARTSGP